MSKKSKLSEDKVIFNEDIEEKIRGLTLNVPNAYSLDKNYENYMLFLKGVNDVCSFKAYNKESRQKKQIKLAKIMTYLIFLKPYERAHYEDEQDTVSFMLLENLIEMLEDFYKKKYISFKSPDFNNKFEKFLKYTLYYILNINDNINLFIRGLLPNEIHKLLKSINSNLYKKHKKEIKKLNADIADEMYKHFIILFLQDETTKIDIKILSNIIKDLPLDTHFELNPNNIYELMKEFEKLFMNETCTYLITLFDPFSSTLPRNAPRYNFLKQSFPFKSPFPPFFK